MRAPPPGLPGNGAATSATTRRIHVRRAHSLSRASPQEPRQLDLFELPYHAPPRPTRDRDEAPPFDDIAQAWQDPTGEPYPGRERVLELFDRARKGRQAARAMSINSTGRGCRSKSHAAHHMAIYDSLPREVRDKLKIANGNLCAGCIRNQLRRFGLDYLLSNLDFSRRFEREKRGRALSYVRREDLKP
jgi:hypothetical protein